MRRRERERGVSLSVEERRKKKEENVLLLCCCCCCCGGSALTAGQSGHAAHIPALDGLVEGLGVVECCMG